MRSYFIPAVFLAALLFAFLAAAPSAADVMTRPVAIVIHGGAGTIRRENLSEDVESAYRAKLAESVRAGHSVLANGGTSRESVIAAIRIMEDSPLFNAGKGAVFTNEARVELDASIMDGETLNAGAITGVGRIRNPIELANAVLEKSPHVMLMGAGAEAFAVEQGFGMVDNSYFHTERRLKQLKRVQESEARTALSEDDDFDKALADKKLSTVGAVAIDRFGNITAGTSTGGMTNKRFGRIGDSPIIGAGTYAENGVCGISATGHGEFFIRAAVAHDICARVAYKQIPLQQAADEVIMDKLVNMGADGGIIGLDGDGNVVFSFNSKGMYRASIDASGKETIAIFR